MREVLFKTIHGSRLYGLAHDDSDEDFYTVVTKTPVDTRFNRQTRSRYAKQKITGNEDSFIVDFGTWVEMCKSGVPQALEAMFSDMAIGEDKIAEFRADFRAAPAVYQKYLDTIKSFAMSEEPGIKKKRHALRLAVNLNQMARTGRFNPTLNPTVAKYITALSHLDNEQVYNIAKTMAWKIK